MIINKVKLQIHKALIQKLLNSNLLNILIILSALILASLFVLPSASAAASFGVTNLACTPSEVAVDTSFSCTVTVRNSGDSSGTIGTVTIYPDEDWLESS